MESIPHVPNLKFFYAAIATLSASSSSKLPEETKDAMKIKPVTSQKGCMMRTMMKVLEPTEWNRRKTKPPK